MWNRRIWKESVVWNGAWNGRKLAVWNMEKSSSIPFHTMPCLPDSKLLRFIHNTNKLKQQFLVKDPQRQPGA